MGDQPMTMVFCYDVARPRTRRKLAEVLEGRAVRVQKSVFEARMTKAGADALFDDAARWLDPGDSLRMYALSAAGLERSRSQGGAPIPEDGGYWLL